VGAEATGDLRPPICIVSGARSFRTSRSRAREMGVYAPRAQFVRVAPSFFLCRLTNFGGGAINQIRGRGPPTIYGRMREECGKSWLLAADGY